MKKRIPLLSVVTIIKNEEKLLPVYFENISWISEKIVIINNSTDSSLEISKQFSKDVFVNNETNLGKLKQYGIKKARGKWILVLDVDERLSEELSREIKKIIKTNTFEAYNIPYKNYFKNKLLKGEQQTYAKVRLFKKSKGGVKGDSVHEEIVIKGSVGALNGYIHHYSFRSVGQIVRKFTYYAKLESPELYIKKEKIGMRQLVLNPLHMFSTLFIDKKGYRDGWEGFQLALFFSYYELMRYVFFALYKLQK